MELRDWAIRILSADTLEEKLFAPPELTDFCPGPAIIWKEPTRPTGMGFFRHTRKNRLPTFHDHKDPYKRAVCLHRFAGHELLAVEIMAYALLAFPEAPKHFRKGLAHTLQEEQGHVRLYMRRLEEMGLKFGDLPLYRNFWAYIPTITSPLRYVSLMSLTFEMANLDFAPLYGASFAKNGDEKSAQLMKKILEDEIGHVSFGCRWLHKWKENDATGYETWCQNIPPKMTPSRAKGQSFFEENRRLAGVPEDWIQSLKSGA
jgi:uncharacterized ferritin-like protein (DUF455 family)